jgi:hypothetical protein
MSCLDCSRFDGPFVSHSFPKSRSVDEILPKYVLPSPKRHEPTVTPRNANLKVIVKVGKEHQGRKILFWAAEPPTKQTLVSQSEAYGQYKNMGTTVVDKNGNAIFFVRQPQVYKVGSKSYPAHVHYSLATSDGKRWCRKVGAVFAPRHACNLSPRLRSSLLILDSGKGGNLIDRLKVRSKDTMYVICGPKSNSLSKSLVNLGHPNVFLA